MKLLKKEKALKLLDSELDKLSTASQTINNTNNMGQLINNGTNNGTINNTDNSSKIANNIKVVRYDDTSNNNTSVTDDNYIEMFKNGSRAIPLYIKKVHFDPLHPERHNIKLTNLRSNTVQIHNGISWEACDTRETIEELIGNCVDSLDVAYERITADGTNKQPKYDKFITRYEECDKKHREQLNKNTKNDLYNYTKTIY